VSIKNRRLYVDGLHGQVHVREAKPDKNVSEGRIPVVCFHQSPMSGLQYRPFQDILGEDRIVWCPDTPGFGGSDTPSAPVTVSDYADSMAIVINNLKIETDYLGPVDILGGHTGSVIATELAVTNPDLVRKIIFPSVAFFSDEEKVVMRKRFGGPPGYFSNPDYIADMYRTSVLNGHSEIPEERRLEMFSERIRSGINAWYAPEAVMSYDCESRLKLIKQSVLIIVLDDMLAENSLKAAKIISNSFVKDLKHISHALAWDVSANEIIAEVREFLDKG